MTESTIDVWTEQICAMIARGIPQSVRNEKWNAPNFSMGGQDMITLNFPPNGSLRVVFHRGANAKDSKKGHRLIADPTGKLVWASDQRASLMFTEQAQIDDAEHWLSGLVGKWCAAVSEKAGR